MQITLHFGIILCENHVMEVGVADLKLGHRLRVLCDHANNSFLGDMGDFGLKSTFEVHYF